MDGSRLSLTNAELEGIFRMKYGSATHTGWDPRMRRRFGHFTPNDYYEAVVAKLVTPASKWLDVGCGRNVFPSNERLARILASRAGLLVGVDPDDTIKENPFVHERAHVAVEHYHTHHTFDVVTLRMVAEHVTSPDGTAAALARLTKPGGAVVVYTINRWSPVPIVTWVVPFALHHSFKRLLWDTEAKDTFPVAYRMNTRRSLRRLFETHGFRESEFAYLDDCRTLGRFRATLFLELATWRVLHAVGVTYPENCLLGIYERR
jgi:SAM-dependent methyltransferase